MSELLSALFIDPIEVNAYWYWLLVPLSAGIAVIYKALKVRHVRQVPLAAIGLMVTILAGMAAAAAALYAIYAVFEWWQG